MFRKPCPGDSRQHLSNELFEFSQAYLTRTRRLLFLRGPILSSPERFDVFSPAAIGDDIMAMNIEDPVTPIYLIIESPGGDIASGFQLFDIIKLSRAPIITVAASCASLATVLICAGTERLALPHSRLMLHLPSSGIKGDAEEIKIRSDLVQEIKAEMVDVYLKRGVTAGLKDKTEAQIRKQLLKDIDREKWLTTKQAMEYGLIDRVVTSADFFGALP